MKVLHLIKTSVGASWALRQTTKLINLGVEVHLALPDGPMVNKYKEAGINVHIFDPALILSKPWLNPIRAYKLRELVKSINPDIIHSHFVATTLLMRIALIGINIPRIFHVPGPLHLEHWFFRQLDIITASKFDYWLASCLWTKEKYLELGQPKKHVGLAYYGVNEEDFHFHNDNPKDKKSALQIDPNTFLIGMVAYFYAPKRYLGQKRGLKGHEDLIDAIEIVKNIHPNIKCVFVGGPWGNAHKYFEEVKEYAKYKTGSSCIFLGTRNDVAKLYSQFDLAVHPSHSENVGGAVESMYAGVPTLTTNIGGFTDLITENETGYLANPKDPISLAKQIIKAIENPHQSETMVKNGLVKVKKVMNVENNAQQVYDFYLHILNSHIDISLHD